MDREEFGEFIGEVKPYEKWKPTAHMRLKNLPLWPVILLWYLPFYWLLASSLIGPVLYPFFPTYTPPLDFWSYALVLLPLLLFSFVASIILFIKVLFCTAALKFSPPDTRETPEEIKEKERVGEKNWYSPFEGDYTRASLVSAFSKARIILVIVLAAGVLLVEAGLDFLFMI